MSYPNFSEEKKLHKMGYRFIAGLDEAGRGPLAGPVVAATVIVLDYKKIKNIKKINDSKKLSKKQREYLYKIITSHPEIKWGVGIVSEKIIDKINILEATKLAMVKSFKKIKVDYLLLDGNFTLRQAQGKKYISQKSIIRGDAKVMSIAMASIIAKVTRDRMMQKYHKKYPKYGFFQHKGYPTKAHFASLAKFGPCKIHRMTFCPEKLSTP